MIRYIILKGQLWKIVDGLNIPYIYEDGKWVESYSWGDYIAVKKFGVTISEDEAFIHMI